MAINKEVKSETEITTTELIKELLLHLYRANTPQTPLEIADILWPQHRSPVFTPPVIENALELLMRKTTVRERAGKFKLSPNAKRFVEEVYLPNILDLSDLSETYDEKESIRIKSLLPEQLSQNLDLSFVLITWEKPTPTHSFKTITETFSFTLPGYVVINGQRQEVKGRTILTLPPGNKISLEPHTPDATLQAFLITKPRFDPKDIVVY